MPKRLILFLLLVIFCTPLLAQLRYAWAGGLNSCQMGNIDLNLDGIPDLVIFDRQGNRILPFLSVSGEFTYAPEYASLFPDLHDWVIFADYNKDGKQDIFTYSLGGVRVFKNVSDTILKFQLVTNLLQSFYYTGYVGILLTPVDYPAIADIDGDGDLDLLTFFGLGSFVEYHKNMSMEKYGTADSLDFRLADNCFGDFKESEGGNHITLNVACPNKYGFQPELSCSAPPGTKHTGSTIWATDLDGSGTKDLVIGDVGFSNLIALYNGGTADTAHMTAMDSLFPDHGNPVKLTTFPVCSVVQTGNPNGLPDLIVSPFDPQTAISENYSSVWQYKNTGTAQVPNYELVNKRFMQDEMIDVGSNSFPVLYDIDGDGLPDLFIGNYGYRDSSWSSQGVLYSSFVSKIAFYKNTGTQYAPAFKEITPDFGGLSSLHLTGLYPAFADLDGDGDIDMIAGNSDGTLLYFENTAGPGHDPVFAPPVLKYQDIDVGEFSAPQLFDLDKDGLTDLIIGEKGGNINYYRNTGTAINPVFNLVTDSLGKVNVTNYNLSYDGYSTPCFYRDAQHTTYLVCGSEEGIIHFYKNIDNNLAGTFAQSDSVYIRPGWRTSPAVAYLGTPDHPDLITGNYSGGLNYYSSKPPPLVMATYEKPFPGNKNACTVYPVPADASVTLLITGFHPGETYIARIVNLAGQTVMTVHPQHPSTIIQTAALPAGFYLLMITGPTDNGTISLTAQKVIIRH